MDTVQSDGDPETPWMDLTVRERLRRNLRAAAKNSGWAEGVAEHLLRLTDEFAAWSAWYNSGSGTFTARLVTPPYQYSPQLHAPTIEELRELIEAREPERRERMGEQS
jgi:hypothetical protein